jgi:hypothetical protein
LVLSGWATSPLGIAGVVVQIEERQWNASYGLDTPALAGTPESPHAERAGYRLRIDTSAWAPRPCYVTVAAFDLEGGRSAIEGSVEIRPFELPSRTVEENLARIEAGRVALSPAQRDQARHDRELARQVARREQQCADRAARPQMGSTVVGDALAQIRAALPRRWTYA